METQRFSLAFSPEVARDHFILPLGGSPLYLQAEIPFLKTEDTSAKSPGEGVAILHEKIPIASDFVFSLPVLHKSN